MDLSPRTKMVSSLRLLVAASRALPSSLRGTMVSPIAIVASDLMVTNTGLSGRGCSAAVEAGRLTPMSTVASGAATMKMINSTSMTSMNGVTLISCSTSRSSLFEPERRIPIGLLRRSRQRQGMTQLPAADDQQQLCGRIAEQGAITADHAREVVVDYDRRDRGDQAERGRQQRFRNARRHHRKIGGVGFG